MKSFTTLAFAASIALSAAQASLCVLVHLCLLIALTIHCSNVSTGTYICEIPDASYCAGDSLNTNIIIRCNGIYGHPVNCDDNLAYQYPEGVSWSPCYQTSKNSGDATCSKNCIIYGEVQSIVANCEPSYTTSTTSPTVTSDTTTITSTSTTTTTTCQNTSSTEPYHWITPITYNPPTTSTSTSSNRYNTTMPNPITPTTIITLTAALSSSQTPINNSMITTSVTTSGSTSPTKTPVGPTTTGPGAVVFTGGASAGAKQAGAVIVVMGILVGLFL